MNNQSTSPKIQKMLAHLKQSYRNFLSKMKKFEQEENQAAKEVLDEVNQIRQEEVRLKSGLSSDTNSDSPVDQADHS